jgi:methionine synthase II (cobalamin-independent)
MRKLGHSIVSEAACPIAAQTTMERKRMIEKDISIEELVQILPASVRYLMERGIKCLACGEPIWGTLASAAREKGFSEHQLDSIVADLNALSRSHTL